jgi:hypothetical protein
LSFAERKTNLEAFQYYYVKYIARGDIHNIIFVITAFAILGSLLILTTALTGHASVGSSNNTAAFPATNLGNISSFAELTLTPNQIAAGGPIPPNYTMAQQEAQCAAALENPPWYPTLMPAEHHDSERTELFPCSQFPGSYSGSNDVYAYPSSDIYYNPFSMATRGIDEMYIYGGGNGDATPHLLSTYVSRVEPGSLNEVWRTYLNNANMTDDFSLSGAVYVLADGSLGATAGHKVYKINATTGAVEASVNLPTGDNPSRDSGFNGFSMFSDGTLVLKSFNRPVGCTLLGYSAAAYRCPGAPGSANPSVLSVVDSKTWKVLDWVQSSENSAGRITATQFHDKDYAYFAGTSNVFRYVWDGKNITLDETWGPVPYLKPGQTLAGAVMIMGNWVILTTNGNPASVPMSVVAISQADDSKIAKIDPIPLESGQKSTYYAHGAVDPDNNRIYAMDAGSPKKAFAVDFNPNTGNMSVAWVEPQWSQSYITLIGPDDKRVFVNTNMSSPVTQNASEMIPWPEGANYLEQIQWRDAETGKLLAASDFFPSAAAYATVPVGYGGLIYDILNIGNIIALQVLPQTNMTSSVVSAPNSNSTSTTSEAS